METIVDIFVNSDNFNAFINIYKKLCVSIILL